MSEVALAYREVSLLLCLSLFSNRELSDHSIKVHASGINTDFFYPACSFVLPEVLQFAKAQVKLNCLPLFWIFSW